MTSDGFKCSTERPFTDNNWSARRIWLCTNEKLGSTHVVDDGG